MLQRDDAPTSCGPSFLCRLQVVCSNISPSEEEAQRASTKGTCMNPITRRSGGQRPRPQGVQRPHSTGNARQKYELYLTLGREAQLAGDTVEMERCYQFADHYFRVMRAAARPDPEDGRGRAHAYKPTTSRL